MESELERVLTHSYKAGMITYLLTHPDGFEEAIKLAIIDKQPYSWRASWLLWSCMDQNDSRIRGYVNAIINTLPDRNDNQQRELLMILQRMEINEKLEGKLFNHCVSVWEKINKAPSVRVNAFKVIIKIARKHPDLLHEIDFLTQPQYLDSLSQAVQKCIFKMMVNLR